MPELGGLGKTESLEKWMGLGALWVGGCGFLARAADPGWSGLDGACGGWGFAGSGCSFLGTLLGMASALYVARFVAKEGATVQIRLTLVHPDVSEFGTDRLWGWKLLVALADGLVGLVLWRACRARGRHPGWAAAWLLAVRGLRTLQTVDGAVPEIAG